ncbi:MAG: hypothetical protein LCH89_00290 [Proteobacteria bacterium]|nr:hypothetical protein [Pseudomonadota bacterium]
MPKQFSPQFYSAQAKLSEFYRAFKDTCEPALADVAVAERSFVQAGLEELYAAAGQAAGVFLPAFDALPADAQDRFSEVAATFVRMGAAMCFGSVAGLAADEMADAF